MPDFLARLTDRLILRPSRNPIDAEDRRREIIATPNGAVEAWVTTNQPQSDDSAESQPIENFDTRLNTESQTVFRPCMIALKFPGVAGRAERGGPHPFELVPECAVEIWTINPLGYGGSEGRATLRVTVSTCDAVWQTVTLKYPNASIFVIGNSLGCLAALYLAAAKAVAGLYLRNPVPVHQMIRTRLRYNWWNFGLARLIANQLPIELDAVKNSKLALAPLLQVSSGLDRVVPLHYQQLIFSAYRGKKEQFILNGVDHHEFVREDQQEDYKNETRKFLQGIIAGCGRSEGNS